MGIEGLEVIRAVAPGDGPEHVATGSAPTQAIRVQFVAIARLTAAKLVRAPHNCRNPLLTVEVDKSSFKLPSWTWGCGRVRFSATHSGNSISMVED